jgi:hypothetical protein
MSFWKSLFSGGTAAGAQQASAPPVEHNGFTITAQPVADGGSYRVGGTITKEIGGTLREHKFVRADTFSTRDEAINFSVVKAKQIIDQQGDRLFG